MREQRKVRQIKSRLMVGIFCVSLFFGEIMATGSVVSAQELVPAARDLALQENDGEKQEPVGGETEEEQTPEKLVMT